MENTLTVAKGEEGRRRIDGQELGSERRVGERSGDPSVETQQLRGKRIPGSRGETRRQGWRTRKSQGGVRGWGVRVSSDVPDELLLGDH